MDGMSPDEIERRLKELEAKHDAATRRQHDLLAQLEQRRLKESEARQEREKLDAERQDYKERMRERTAEMADLKAADESQSKQ